MTSSSILIYNNQGKLIFKFNTASISSLVIMLPSELNMSNGYTILLETNSDGTGIPLKLKFAHQSQFLGSECSTENSMTQKRLSKTDSVSHLTEQLPK